MKTFSLTETSKYVYNKVSCDVYTYSCNEKIVKFFLHPTESFSFMFMSSTNVPARLRNKVADAFVSAGSSNKSSSFEDRIKVLTVA